MLARTDVLELCLEAIDANPGWAGFSCATLPVTHNRLSQAEAAMYVADIEEAMLVHSWPRNLYQCFVTAREAYQDCGGFRPALGQFAEWALAASYLQRGYRIGYFPQAKFHHYYSGSLKTVTDFTANFVSGEMHYFGGDRGEYFSPLLEVPPEWVCQANFEREAARSLLRVAVQALRPWRRDWRHFADSLARIARWASPALFGDRVARLAATASARCARLVLVFAIAVGPRAFLDHQFRKYIAGLIKARRLAAIADQRRARDTQPPPEHVGYDLDDFTLGASGFFPLETFQGSSFRWSETAACVVVRVAAGAHEIRIDCIAVRDLSDPATDLRFYIDGSCIANSRISTERHRIRVSLDNTEAACFRLGWTCARFAAAADPRRLGLPIERIELSVVPTPVTR